MIASVITIILGVIAFVMFSKPVFWAYSGAEKDILNDIYRKFSCYDVLNFEKFESVYHLLGQIFLLLGMLFAGIMILLALANLFGKASGNQRTGVEVRLIACGFFFFMLASAVMFMIYMAQTTGQTGINDVMTSTLGYGFISALGIALLSVIFAPSRRKVAKKPKEKKEKAKKQ